MSKLSKNVRSRGRHTYLDLGVLETDPDTQKKMNLSWVKAHAPEFDPDLFGEIVVSLRGGRYYIVDGQHRVEMLRQLGWSDQKVPCLLYEGLTLPEEAELFLGLADRRSVRAIDKYRIAVTAGEEIACDIDRIVRAQGLVVADAQKDGCISAVESLRRVYMGAGLAQKSPAALAKALHLLKEAWGLSSRSFDGWLILGAGLVVIRYNGQLDLDAMAAMLSKVSGGPSGLIGRARSVREVKRRDKGHCTASVLVDVYNQRKRATKLEDWWA